MYIFVGTDVIQIKFCSDNVFKTIDVFEHEVYVKKNLLLTDMNLKAELITYFIHDE